MVKKAGTYGYLVDPSYDDVYLKEESSSFAVFLSMNEITRIYYYENLTRKQQRIRDLFIIGCLTGLRYSDYSNLNKEDFQDEFIVKTTKKTNRVIIPLHEYVKEILEKYEYDLPKNISIQYFNRYVKLICKKIGLNEVITNSYMRGNKIITESKEKWELISSHTARRSAATNMYMTGRMKTSDIMTTTGHTTESSFFRYIKTSTEDKVKSIAGDSYFRI